jgi:hypothetical protein
MVLVKFKVLGLVGLCAFAMLLVQPCELAFSNPQAPQAKKQPPPVPPTPPPTKPLTKPLTKPKPDLVKPTPSITGHSTASPTVTGRTSVPMRSHHFSGTTPKSLTWQSHHLNHRWIYEVRFRSPLWINRVFDSELAALTFMNYLRFHGFLQFLSNPSDDTWVVTYWGLHWRTFGTYASLSVARVVEAALVFDGFPAWVVWRPIYYYW